MNAKWRALAPRAGELVKQKIIPKLNEAEGVVYPAKENIFRAFNEVDPENVRVVLLGQDPYHDGSATGLAFDNIISERLVAPNRTAMSPSLRSILQEMESDIGEIVEWEGRGGIPESHLAYLPQQGVLLANTALTVEKGKAESHTELWKEFTEEIIKALNGMDNIVWILLGAHAKSYKKFITNETHKFVEAGHPSPLNRAVPFKGSKVFSKTNELLIEMNKEPIKW